MRLRSRRCGPKSVQVGMQCFGQCILGVVNGTACGQQQWGCNGSDGGVSAAAARQRSGMCTAAARVCGMGCSRFFQATRGRCAPTAGGMRRRAVGGNGGQHGGSSSSDEHCAPIDLVKLQAPARATWAWGSRGGSSSGGGGGGGNVARGVQHGHGHMVRGIGMRTDWLRRFSPEKSRPPV